MKAATSGLHALEQLRDGFRPTVILLDIMMQTLAAALAVRRGAGLRRG